MTACVGPLPRGYEGHLAEVRRVATHVLARARHQAVGRFGLVATPGGLGTPAFGPDATVVRLTAHALVVEHGGDVTVTPTSEATLATLARAAGADLDLGLSVGTDTPPLGDPDAPLTLDPATVGAVGGWLALGWEVLDRVVAEPSPPGAPDPAPAPAPARIQLWPEHFDAATSVAVGPGPDDRVNLGASTGDAAHPAPYLYVGPWGTDRPGDEGYWNVPFGALLDHDELLGTPDPVASAVWFVNEGIRRLRDGS